jgi:hypothetical protein
MELFEYVNEVIAPKIVARESKELFFVARAKDELDGMANLHGCSVRPKMTALQESRLGAQPPDTFLDGERDDLTAPLVSALPSPLPPPSQYHLHYFYHLPKTGGTELSAYLANLPPQYVVPGSMPSSNFDVLAFGRSCNLFSCEVAQRQNHLVGFSHSGVFKFWEAISNSTLRSRQIKLIYLVRDVVIHRLSVFHEKVGPQRGELSRHAPYETIKDWVDSMVGLDEMDGKGKGPVSLLEYEDDHVRALDMRTENETGFSEIELKNMTDITFAKTPPGLDWIGWARAKWEKLCVTATCNKPAELMNMQLKPFFADVNQAWRTTPIFDMWSDLHETSYPLRCEGRFEGCPYTGSNATIGLIGHADDLRTTLCVINRKLGLPVEWEGLADNMRNQRVKTVDRFRSDRPMDVEPSFNLAATQHLLNLEARELAFEKLALANLEQEAGKYGCSPPVPPSPPKPVYTCTSSKFHVFQLPDGIANGETEQRCAKRLPDAPDVFEALKQHPCHSPTAYGAVSVVIGHVIHKPLKDDCDNVTQTVLSMLPPQIATHPRLFFVPEGSISSFGRFRAEWPDAVWLSSEPQVSCEGETEFEETGNNQCWRSVNASLYQFFPYVCTPHVIGVPYLTADMMANLGSVTASTASRPALVSYYGGVDGPNWAVDLRERLYDLCEDDWLCPVNATDAHGITSKSIFCLVSAGNSPSSVTAFTAVRLGCVPVFFSTTDDVFYYKGYKHFLGHDNSTGFGLRNWSVLLNVTAVMTNETYLSKELKRISSDNESMARVLDAMEDVSERIMFSQQSTVRSGFMQTNLLTLLADILLDVNSTSCDGELTLPASPVRQAPHIECQAIPEGKRIAVAAVWVDLNSSGTEDQAEADALANVCEVVMSLQSSRAALTSDSLCLNETDVDLVIYTDGTTLANNTREMYQAAGIVVKDASTSDAMQQYAMALQQADPATRANARLYTVHMYKLAALWDTEYAAIVVSDTDVILGAPSSCNASQLQGERDSCEEPFDILNLLLDPEGPDLFYQHSTYSPGNAGLFAGRPNSTFYQLFASGIQAGYDPATGWGGHYDEMHLARYTKICDLFHEAFPDLWLWYNGIDANGTTTWCKNGTAWCFIGADQDQGMLAHMMASDVVRSADLAAYIPNFKFVHHTGKKFKAKPWDAYGMTKQSDGGAVNDDLHDGLTEFWGEYSTRYHNVWSSAPALVATRCPRVYSCLFDDIATYSDTMLNQSTWYDALVPEKNQTLTWQFSSEDGLYHARPVIEPCPAHREAPAPAPLPQPVLYAYSEDNCPDIPTEELVDTTINTVELRWNANGTWNGTYSRFQFPQHDCVAIARMTLAARELGDLPKSHRDYSYRFYPHDSLNKLYGCRETSMGDICDATTTPPELCPNGNHDPVLAFSVYDAPFESSDGYSTNRNVSCVQLIPNVMQLTGDVEDMVERTSAITEKLKWSERDETLLYMEGKNDRLHGRFLRSRLWLSNETEDSSWLYTPDHIDQGEAAKFRYILDVSTTTMGSWSSLAWKLASGALVFRVKNRALARDLWHELILPDRHVLEVEPDFSDLHEKYQWALDHPRDAEAIAQRGQRIAQHYQTKKFAQSAFYEVLSGTYAAYDKPSYVPPNLPDIPYNDTAPIENMAPVSSCDFWNDMDMELRMTNTSSSTCRAMDTHSLPSANVTTKLTLLVSDHGSGSTSFIEAAGNHECAFSLGEPMGGQSGQFNEVLDRRNNPKLEAHIANGVKRFGTWPDPGGKWAVPLPLPEAIYECLTMEGLGAYLMRVAQHVCGAMPLELVNKCGGTCVAHAKVFPAYIGGLTDPINSARVYNVSDPVGAAVFNAAALKLWNDIMFDMAQMPNTKIAMLVRDEESRCLSNWRRFTYETEWYNCDVERSGKETVFEASARRITGAPIVDIKTCFGGDAQARGCVSLFLGLHDLNATDVDLTAMTTPSTQANAGLNASCNEGGWLKMGGHKNETQAVRVPPGELSREISKAQHGFAQRAAQGIFFNKRCGVGLSRPTKVLPELG